MQEMIEAVYEQGVFRPLGNVPLTEGETVRLTFESLAPSATDPAYNLASMAEETGIADLALNIDHYLYGLPKRDDE
jgi:predicted DNA-binding antitoxin AbrB/MazE fold protein